MKDWVKKSLQLLEDSLHPTPQELNELDWKSDLSANTQKLASHLSGFSNLPGGGFMVFGIENKAGLVIGIDKNKIDQILSNITSVSRDMLDPSPKIDHAVESYQHKTILIVFIKESSVKPVHFKGESIEHSFIRTGGTTRKATRQDIGSLLLNSKSLRYEELHASKLIDAKEVFELIDYEEILGLLGKPVPSNKKEILNWLEKEKMIDKVDDTGYYIRNFGAIVAANDIRKFDDISRKAIRLIKYKGLNKIITEQEIVGQKGYALAFSRLIQFIKVMLPHSEEIKKALRQETSVYPEIALRELIANALVHQDFTITGKSVMIEIYDNRIEISNPGRLLPSKKIDRLIGTNPESRNEILASAMRRYKICEERGTGFMKSVDAIELYGLPPLAFEEGENYFKVIMYGPKTFAQMTSSERIDACYQHTTLKYLSGSAMTNTTLRERLKVSEKNRSMISRIIKDTLDAGKIKFKNPESNSIKFAEYIPYYA